MDDSIQTSQDCGYDPSYEWPGTNDTSTHYGEDTEATTSKSRSCLRLVVKGSSVLPPKRRVAVLDAYDEVQLGRDASNSQAIPRIRLKDMEVSKLHATLYWDHEKGRWAIVDMGSKHGTFVRQATQSLGSSSSNLSAPSAVRLSPSRHTSLPRSLNHLDELSIGSTDLIVHIHPGGIPCEECDSQLDLDIPLFTTTKASTQKISSTAEIPAIKSRDPKKAITLLKRTLLSRHSSEGSCSDSTHEKSDYIDRSARRRLLHPYSRSDSFEISAGRTEYVVSSSRHVSSRNSSPLSISYTDSPSISNNVTPAGPLSVSNIGHRMLSKQGWTLGSALGAETPFPDFDSSRTALIEPLDVQANVGRAGLGMRTIPVVFSPHSIASDWKEQTIRRRWEEAHNTR